MARKGKPHPRRPSHLGPHPRQALGAAFLHRLGRSHACHAVWIVADLPASAISSSPKDCSSQGFTRAGRPRVSQPASSQCSSKSGEKPRSGRPARLAETGAEAASTKGFRPRPACHPRELRPTSVCSPETQPQAERGGTIRRLPVTQGRRDQPHQPPPGCRLS